MRKQLDITKITSKILKGLTYREVAEQESERLGIHVSRNVIAGIVRDLKSEKLLVPLTHISNSPSYIYGVEDDNGGIPVFTGHPVLEGDVMIAADFHAPHYNKELVYRLVAVAKHHNIRKLHIAGDLQHGGSAAKHHKRFVTPVSTSKEIQSVNELLDYLFEWFGEIWYTPGNHDLWFLENLEGDLTFTDYARLFGDRQGLFVSPYDRITHCSGNTEWTVPHQSDYSKNKLVVANTLAQKFQTNVICPHQHFSAVGFDEWGRYIIMDIGGMHTPEKFDFVQLKTSRAPNMNTGFASIKNGLGELWTLDDRLTDWGSVLANG